MQVHKPRRLWSVSSQFLLTLRELQEVQINRKKKSQHNCSIVCLIFRVIGRSRFKSLLWTSGSQILREGSQLETRALFIPTAACRRKYRVAALIARLKEEREKHARVERSCADKAVKKVLSRNSRFQKEAFC